MLKKLLTYARSRLARLDENTLEVVKKIFSSTIVKVAGMTIGLGVSVFLGRTIGAEGLGIINLANKMVIIVISISLLGISNLLIRDVAYLKEKKDYQRIKNMMHTSYIVNGLVSLCFSLLFILFAPVLSENFFNEPRLKWPLVIAAITITPQVFSKLFSAFLIGYRKIWQSNLVDNTLSIFITGICLIVMYILSIQITVINVAIAYAIGRLGVTLSIGAYWGKISHNDLKKHKTSLTPNIFLKAKPFFLITVIGILATNIDQVMLGWLSNSREVGLYTVASKIAMLTIFFLQITNSAISPKISALYNNGKTKELEIMIRKITSGLGLIALLPLIIFFFWGKQILLIWGNEFTEAYTVLIVLTIGQFVNITTGSVSTIMNMCGLEKINSRITVIFFLINILLNYFSIKYFGIVGLAVTTAANLIIINITKVIIVKRQLGILSLPKIFF